ncbi:hypothetical protein CAPTEDRAFT_221486 [Capitella teleta]|uniref:Uncharacterized protein n=1 Tax=Capitella teleta TaxID=283909 RepID=R7TR62_CAPTE|nr:hypothetical protein CAPTEDRAFT_221486 [Capitella teleta]|eukprot:ELT93981.1 hypothetical protein CAPTEDRAFT_221486 [Capitella teleta]
MEKKLPNVFVGAETGLIKGVSSADGSWANLNTIEKANRDLEVQCMCWGNEDQTEICFGRRNQTIQVISSSGNLIEEIDASTDEGHLVGLSKIDDMYMTCTSAGAVRLWENGACKAHKSIDAGPDVCRMRSHPRENNILATGGKENDLKVWDVERTSAPVFAAKNVRNDWLDLRVPVWISDLAFSPEDNTVITCTRHQQVRVYDLKSSQRRPAFDMTFTDQPLMALSLTSTEKQIVVGTSHGYMGLLDLRGKGVLVQAYKSFAGSVRCIQCHSSQPVVASCGLDRFLRIHRLNSKEPDHKIYLKSRLNCLLFSDANPFPEDVKTVRRSKNKKITVDNSGIADVENDALWDQLEVVGQKRKSEDEEKKKKKKKNKKEGELCDAKTQKRSKMKKSKKEA